jgi:iron complex outermembrane receptor protein
MGTQGTSRNLANGGRGANFAGIHQLVPERTLTLYNSRRFVSSIRDTLGLGVDLQAFPVNMIERVEVLADGASAVYGSDAIAGVINVIPDTKFEGMEISAGAGTPQDSGGDHYDAGVRFGIQGDRGFFTAGLTTVKDEDVDFQDRDFSQLPLLGQVDAGGGTILNLFGSGIPPEGRHPGANIIFLPNPVTGESFQAYDTFCDGTAPIPDGATPLSIDCIVKQGHRFNYNDIPSGVSLINENKNVNFGAMGEYRFDNEIVGYINANLAHREGTLNFTPLPIADAAGRFTDLIQVPYTNPHIPADALPVILAADGCTSTTDPTTCPNTTTQMWWRGLDLGPRIFHYDADTIQGTFGLKGDVDLMGKPWTWDVWYTGGRSELYERTDGQINVGRLAIAVDPVACALDNACPKDANGQPTLDIFGRSAKSAEEIEYLLFDDQERTEYEMYMLGTSLSGDLAELPAGTLSMATGFEWRQESGGVDTSGVVQNGDSGGNFAQPTDGDYDVWEAYVEFAIPLVANMPLVHELSVDAAGRYSDYETFGNESTYQLALSYAPIESVRLRAVAATGFRAPNILELFGGTADTFLGVEDPCSAASPSFADPNVQANCAAAGVPPGFVQNAAQLKISSGGNENLEAETSDSWTVGIVWQPDFIPLRVAVDWYNVEVDDAIGTPDPVDVINACYNSPNGSLSAAECQRIGRGQSGSVVRFDLLNENLATIETSGLDVNTTFTWESQFGVFQIDWLLNYLDEYTETTESGVVSDRTGKVAGLTTDWAAYPEYRSNLSVNWTFNNWSAGVTWRYLDEMDIFDSVGVDNVNTKVDAVDYFDLFGGYQMGAWNLSVGVHNATDEEPPYVTDISANTSAVYDFLGRFIFGRVSVAWE